MLSLREKIYQMFILGLSGEDLSMNPMMQNALQNNLGGVIFFTQNILSVDGFKKLLANINKEAKTPLFLSIDQEGGRVERTLNLHNGSKYLCAREAAKKGESFVKKQTKEIAEELKDFGINMNFAPVLDVDTNPLNPIIAERSFSSDTDEVIKYADLVFKTYLDYKIIPVGKHFPGHGETSVDSHKNMPVLDLSLDELEKIHIKPFEELIKKGLPAVMAAHIHYTAFNKEKLPASISKNVLTAFLRKKIGFKGLIISDDMVMGGIKGFSSLDACKRGIEAGINMFIFRDSNAETIELIEQLVKEVENGTIDISKIDFSVQKILQTKKILSF